MIFLGILQNVQDERRHLFCYSGAGGQTQGNLREALSAYKLEVAKSYASIGYIKDIERRLTEHLVRIESKLDGAQAQMANGGRL
ncbi:MAG: hypothetical protein EPN26_06160 [Rhodospirillales bacterium]|nr:MAG: hypothetical protein EPN26_06160 [Rhodospirillales bacterium]